MLNRRDEQRLLTALGRAADIARADGLVTAVVEASPALTRRDFVFDHIALLVFPDAVDDVSTFLQKRQVEVADPIESVVVRSRLAQRYGVNEQSLEVTILYGRLPEPAQAGVEVFILPSESAVAAHSDMPARERATEAERHEAWLVDGASLAEVRRVCLDRLGMIPDGGGFNPHEGKSSGGRTVLYFHLPTHLAGEPRRLELKSDGHWPDVLAAHKAAGAGAQEPYRQLLGLLAGHWAARAVHVATELNLNEHLRDGPRTVGQLAQRLNCDEKAVARLLRYLSRAGIVREVGDSIYLNTPAGDLLCADNPFADLVKIYGGEFYDAWGEFPTALRTGGTAFRHRFGAEHFDHFAAHSDSAQVFDRAMQSITSVIAVDLAKTYDFAPGSRIVDIGGGNGTLLRTLLRSHETVHGTVFDREHVVGKTPADPELGDRLQHVPGDFFAEVPSGADVYVLSRVLHDWNDDDCVRILSSCRRACGPDATLLVLERLLPDEWSTPGSGELAALWDLQMLAITGGQERDLAHYERLLRTAGFRLAELCTLGVDMNLIVAESA
ncbi:methyltransferase [Streptomyces sp. NPDC048281]|uniref:methyltransferase n=1 Tax=Streptomyces sp. NPDC048281 TaxID=3154715 RepID=UPI00341751D0